MSDPKVVSVCMTLPSKLHPTDGIFVYRRLQAIAEQLPLAAIRPRPWFPFLKPAADDALADINTIPVESPKMFYLPGMAKWLDARWMERSIRRLVRQAFADEPSIILDAHFGYPEGAACHRVARKLGIPYAVTMRGVEEDWAKHSGVRRQLSAALQCASAVIAVSDSLGKLARELGVPSARLHLVPNGCDTSVFCEGDKALARNQLGLSPSKPIIVSVARIHPVKGHDVLVESFTRHFKDFEGEVLLIGSKPSARYYQSLRRQITDHGLSETIRFLDPIPPKQVAQYLQAADLFVLASHREGCCNAILEALACRTPVVATSVGDNRAVRDRYQGMTLVEPGDSSALAEAIKQSLSGRDLMTQNDKPVFASLAWDNVGQQCADIFRSIASPS